MSLKEKIENNLALSIIAIAITSFGLGWGVPQAMLKAGNSVVITAYLLEKLQHDSDELRKLTEKPAIASTKPKVRIVFVDTTKRPYIKEYSEGNAKFLVHHIEESSTLKELIDPVIKRTDEDLIGPEPSAYQLAAEAVEKENPDLVVIHRSAFYTENEQDPNEAKLVAFLKGMKKTDVIFLLYSRKDDTDSKYAADIENKTGLNGRIYPYRFRPGNPFNDKSQVDHFINTILLLAHARIDQKGQSRPT